MRPGGPLDQELAAQRSDDDATGSGSDSEPASEGGADDTDGPFTNESDSDGPVAGYWWQARAWAHRPDHWFITYDGLRVCCDNCKSPASAAPCPVCLTPNHCEQCGTPPDHDCRKNLDERFNGWSSGAFCTICD